MHLVTRRISRRGGTFLTFSCLHQTLVEKFGGPTCALTPLNGKKSVPWVVLEQEREHYGGLKGPLKLIGDHITQSVGTGEAPGGITDILGHMNEKE